MKSQKNVLYSTFKPVIDFYRIVGSTAVGRIGLLIVGVMLVFVFIGPHIIPFGIHEFNYNADGSWAQLNPPSSKHLFGTDSFSRDVLSHTIMGSRISIMVGFTSGVLIGLIGTIVGVIPGYYGGMIDNIFMRLTDIAYGLPFLPFAIILSIMTKPGVTTVILTICLLYWRTGARVIRSQVLTLRERPYILAAKASGVSNTRIMFFHLLPNVFHLTILYVVFGMGWGVFGEAGLSFVGLGDPIAISWGKMLSQAFLVGAIRNAWWWVLPPGLSLMFLTIAIFFIGKTYEEAINPRLQIF